MSVQRNAIVAPFSVLTPLLDAPKSTIKVGGKPVQTNSGSGTVAIAHQKWFTEVQNGINASIQLSTNVPAHSNSHGQPGTVVLFSGGFYLCVGSNSWLKFVGAAF